MQIQTLFQTWKCTDTLLDSIIHIYICFDLILGYNFEYRHEYKISEREKS